MCVSIYLSLSLYIYIYIHIYIYIYIYIYNIAARGAADACRRAGRGLFRPPVASVVTDFLLW